MDGATIYDGVIIESDALANVQKTVEQMGGRASLHLVVALLLEPTRSRIGLPALYSTPIGVWADENNLSRRARFVIQRMGITTVGDLSKQEMDLASMRGCGTNTEKEIRLALAKSIESVNG